MIASFTKTDFKKGFKLQKIRFLKSTLNFVQSVAINRLKQSYLNTLIDVIVFQYAQFIILACLSFVAIIFNEIL